MSHSDIAFVVKFKFNEGGSEIGGGAVPHHGASASRLIYQDIVFVSGLYLGSIVKFNAFYEYCSVFQVICVRVRGGDRCDWRYQGGK